jgi:sulfide dehydrogenase cytochrome subunit
MKARHAFIAGMVLCGGAMSPLAAEAPPGAESCSGCHAAKAGVDTPVPRLAGQDATATVAAMQAYRSGQRPATVMDRIAKGFSDDEIKAIATWFGAQP